MITESTMYICLNSCFFKDILLEISTQLLQNVINVQCPFKSALCRWINKYIINKQTNKQANEYINRST